MGNVLGDNGFVGSLGHMLFGDGGASKIKGAYGQAAGDLRQQAGQWQNLGQTGWNQQMEGAGEASNAYGGSQQWASNLSNNYTPYVQDAYRQVGGQFTQPSQIGSYAQQMGNRYGSGPSSTQSYGDWASGQLSGPSQMQGQYGQAQQNFSGPSQSALAQSRSSGQLDYSAGQANYGNKYAAYDSAAAQANQSAARIGEGQSSAGANAAAMMKTVGDQGAQRTRALGAGLGLAAGELGGQGGVAKYEGTAAGAFGQANAVQQFGQRQGGQLEQRSGIEDFANQLSATGSNPYLDRQRQQGQDNLNQQMAKRGAFNSGGAMAALGNYNAALDAEKFKYQADILNQGQSAKLARLGQAQGLAQATTGENLSRGQAFQGLGQSLSQEQIGRQGARLNATGMEQSNLSDMTNQTMRASQQQDASSLGWAGLQNQASQSAGQMQLAALQGQQQAANSVDQNTLARMQAQFGMAQGVDQTQMARQQMLGQMANQTDMGQLARLQGGYGMIQGGDQMNLQQQQFLGNLYGQADNARFAGATGYLNAAGAANGAQMSEDAARYGRQFGLDQAQAGITQHAYDMGGQRYDRGMEGGLNALANATQMGVTGTLSSAQAAGQATGQIIGLGSQIGAMFAGMPPTGGGGGYGGQQPYQYSPQQYQPSYMQAPQLQMAPQSSYPAYMQQQQPYNPAAFSQPMQFNYGY